MDLNPDIKLARPLIIFDIEGTGLDTQEDRIVEISIMRISTNGHTELNTRRLKPGIPIPPDATEIHKITNEDVEDCLKFGQVAHKLHDYIKDCDIAGYNSNQYDIPLLANEFYRCGIDWDISHVNVIDIGNLYKILNPRSLEDAYRQYVGEELEGAHSADADVRATLHVLNAMLVKHDVPTDPKKLAIYSNYGNERMDVAGRFVKGEDGTVLINFAKYKGQPANEHPDFLEWMVFKASFPRDTTMIAQQILQGGAV